MMVCKDLLKYVFLETNVLWCDVHTLFGSLVLCVSASMFFFLYVLCLKICH